MVVSSVVSAVAGTSEAHSAASAQENVANQASQTEQGFFNTANTNLQPYIQAGDTATNTISQLEGASTPATYDNAGYQNALTAYNNANAPAATSAPSNSPWSGGQLQQIQQAAAGGDQTAQADLSAYGISWAAPSAGTTTPGPAPTLSQFQTSPGSTGGDSGIMATLQGLPGYQFANQQGLKSVQNAATARGLGLSGASLKGAANYSTGLANQYYNNLLTGLQNTANTGAGAGASLAGDAVSTGQSIGSNQIGAGNAAAAGDIATGNAISNAVGNTSQGLIASSLLQNSGNQSGIFGNGLTGQLANGFGGASGASAGGASAINGAELGENGLISFGTPFAAAAL